MATPCGYFVILALLIATPFFRQINAEDSDQMVAFLCNRPSMYKTTDGWVKDDTVDCLKDPEDILDYCRKIYPDVDVRNIVEASEKIEIEHWCDFGQSLCHQKFTVRPFRCLVGPFQSDALLVPEHCVFDHVHDAKLCTSYGEWNRTAVQSCVGRGLSMQSFAILQPCGVDKFNGVEFVCCPRDQAIQSTATTTTTARPPTTGDRRTTEKSLPVAPTARLQTHVGKLDVFTQYVRQVAGRDSDESVDGGAASGHAWNEHEYYAKARSDMQKHHHEKIAKMMKEWSAARQRVQDLKASDAAAGEKLNRDITSKFQKMYETEEAEVEVEKKQLALLHQQRVQAELDDRKRRMLDNYIEAIENDYDDEEEADPVAVLKALTAYIKALQKDRLHTVNRYRHLRQTQPSDADSTRQQMIEHLIGVDKQMTAALGMLDRLPAKYAAKIKKQIADYMEAYHAVDASILLLFGPLNVATTTIPTTTETTTTPTTTTTSTTTTTVAPIIDESDGSDDEDEEEEEEEEESVEDSSENAEEREFKSAMKSKQIDVDDDDDEEDVVEDEKKIVKSDEVKDYENDDSTDEDEEEEDDDDDDDKPLTELPRSSSSSSLLTSTASPVSAMTSTPSAVSQTQRLDDGLFDDRGDSGEAAEQFDSIDYVHVQLPAAAAQSNGGHADNLEKSPLAAHQAIIQKKPASAADGFSAVPLGIAVGCITVCVVIIAGVVVMRRRGSARRRGGNGSSGTAVPAGPGRLQLDPTASSEERHVAAMQMTGYENPTYKYFEAGTA